MLYGTNLTGGSAGLGTVFQLAPPAAPGGLWTETILHSFQGGNDGAQPFSGVLIGPNGVLYGSTPADGGTLGTVFELTPPSAPGGAWTHTVFYNCREDPKDGWSPSGSLATDSNGVIYGATSGGGDSGLGTVFAVTPPAAPGGSWTETVLHSFTGTDGAYPYDGVIMGDHGVLYGATFGAKRGANGTVYALQPPAVPGAVWTLAVLHRFAAGAGEIYGGLTLGPNGAIFGTTQIGGVSNAQCTYGTCGTVFSVLP